jgi:hypothetical protein
MYVIYAWMDMVDVMPGNFLDMWTTDASAPRNHYVMHYSLDFGRSLGVMGTKNFDRRSGFSNRFDWGEIGWTLVTGGFASRPWEGRTGANIRGVPYLLESQWFRPDLWKPGIPYTPFNTMDRFDGFWGTKIVMRFTRPQIRAAVEAGRFSDPRAVDYITDVLVARQHKTAEYWYQQVNPLDEFRVDDQLCFADLAIAQGYAPSAFTHYTIAGNDVAGHPVGAPLVAQAASNGRICVALPPLAAGRDNYTIFAITTYRSQFQRTTYLHVARDPAGLLRVIGIYRV